MTPTAPQKTAAPFACGFFIAGIWLFIALLLGGCSSQQRNAPTHSAQADEVVFSAMQQVGKPYRYGGSSPQTGFDCSGLIQYVYLNSVGISTPRTVNALANASYPAVNQTHLNSGDLVIFSSNRQHQPDHAGIYVGQGRFVHAPSTGGIVRLDSLNDNYWQKHFLTGKSVLSNR